MCFFFLNHWNLTSKLVWGFFCYFVFVWLCLKKQRKLTTSLGNMNQCCSVITSFNITACHVPACKCRPCKLLDSMRNFINGCIYTVYKTWNSVGVWRALFCAFVNKMDFLIKLPFYCPNLLYQVVNEEEWMTIHYFTI